ncbi:M24 family metallopeptidase [Thermocrinis sp.]
MQVQKDVREKIRELLAEHKLDAFLFSSQPNVLYISGFRSSNAYVLATRERFYLFTDARYYERAKQELKEDWELVLLKSKPFRIIKQTIKKQGVKVVGFEKDRISCVLRESLRSRGISWKGFSNFIGRLRAIKGEKEINIMKEGVQKTDQIYRELLNLIKPGMSELEVRAFIVNRALSLGAFGESFPAIVAFREGSAVPHWETSQRKLEERGPLLIDMGVLYKHYCTDFTRTIFIGKADDEFRKIYQIVRDAHLYALEKVKVGTPIGEVDRVARDYIKRKGYGKYFTHGTGHGVGIEIHEFPRVYYKGKDASVPIEEGMVFTIEPGIYLPGKFGVRLENMVVVRNGVAQVLSEVSLDLVEI